MDQRPGGYYSKLKELQANIKRSKLEHRELEYEFQKLMIQRSDCDRSAMKSYRNKYNSILEDEKRRGERNEKIKQMLERIDYQASALAAKSDRLKMLKGHYEKQLFRCYGPNSTRSNSSDRSVVVTPKQRTKSVDAHTQIPRPNYEIFNVEDAMANYRNFEYRASPTVSRGPRSASTSRIIDSTDNNHSPDEESRSVAFSSIAPCYSPDYNAHPAERAPRSASTSRIIQPTSDYKEMTLKAESRSVAFNPDVQIESLEKDPAPAPPGNKGVRLFFGHELMNLPNLKVDHERAVHESKLAPRPYDSPFEDRQYPPMQKAEIYDSNSTANPDYGMYQNSGKIDYPADCTNVQDSNPYNDTNINRRSQASIPVIKNPTVQSTYAEDSYQYPNPNYTQSSLHSAPIIKAPTNQSRLDDTEYQYNHDPNTPQSSLSNSDFLKNPPIQATNIERSYQYSDSNPPHSFVPNAPISKNPLMDKTSTQNQPPIAENEISLATQPYIDNSKDERIVNYTANNGQNQLSVQDDSRSKELDDKNAQGIYNAEDEHTIKPVLPVQNNPTLVHTPKPPIKIMDGSGISLSQGIHQVWEKVVDVEVVNKPETPAFQNEQEPRNDVIDKIYKEISSLGETAPNVDELNESGPPHDIDNRAEIIDKIEEHYYGEKIQSDNEIDNYNSNAYQQSEQEMQNFEIPQIPIEQQQHLENSTTSGEYHQDPNINYDANQAAAYDNYNANDQYYNEHSNPGTIEFQDMQNPDPGTNYQMQPALQDPNYMYDPNYSTETIQPEYAVDQQNDPQNYGETENQNQQLYTEEQQNLYYNQQQQNVEQPYGENAVQSDIIQQQQNPAEFQQFAPHEMYENTNYDQNLNADGYPLQYEQQAYNETPAEPYQDGYNVTDQQQPVESAAISYENSELVQNSAAINEVPSSSDHEEISINQDPSISSTEQITPVPAVPDTRVEEEKIDLPSVLKPQSEPKKKRVNFLDSDSEQSIAGDKQKTTKVGKDGSDSDFEFSVKSN